MSHSTDPEKQFTTHTSSLSLEKGEVTHNEVRKVAENEYDEETAHAKDDAHRDIDHGFDPAFVKRTRRKVDWRVSLRHRNGEREEDDDEGPQSLTASSFPSSSPCTPSPRSTETTCRLRARPITFR